MSEAARRLIEREVMSLAGEDLYRRSDIKWMNDGRVLDIYDPVSNKGLSVLIEEGDLRLSVAEFSDRLLKRPVAMFREHAERAAA